MENIPEIREEPSLLALAETIDSTSIFEGGGAEHFRLPCAANATHNDQVCPIIDYLPICNELLFDVGMELREQRGGSLYLVCFKPGAAEVVPPRDVDLYRANTFLRWLLRTHVCITGLKLQYKWVTAHSQVILEELPENSRLRKLRVQFDIGDTAAQNHFATLLPRLQYLEELYCYMSPSSDTLLAAMSELLRTTTCLRSLVFYACQEKGQPPKTLIDALAANTTLRSLEMWANWNTAEPPGTLGEYVRSNRLLTKLVLFGEETDREELSLDEALVRNCTLTTLDIHRLCGGETTAGFLTKILAECASITKLTLGGLRDEYVNISEATLTRCGEALTQNDTLEELKLSYSLWHPDNWIAFFAFLPNNTHLKKLEVSNHWPSDYGTFVPVLEALANTKSSGRVSFGSYMCKPIARDFIRFGAFSRIEIYGELSLKVSVLQRLPALDHFTSLSLGLYEADQTLFSSLAKYVRATAMLQELRLCVSSPGDAAYSSCWTLLLESILANTSITLLLISSSGNLAFNDRLAATIGLSRYTANALEKVSRRPALVRKLAEKEGMVAGEVARMIRSRLRGVEGLHDFMRLTGVVKECVMCAPPVNGCGVQLEDLNSDCWRLVRQYLSFDDVKASPSPSRVTPCLAEHQAQKAHRAC
ncbi:hypothetical protein HPB52_017639 [Rhipicephalus sanguineus]|uniref:Nlr family card domain protein n=1 Tax=Rhipicephalus sanguineus TaxID=34632 RepID=A0A9D4PK17_RHISA|nr:hypothetical protein HPB52_017639 [Rhipicephalus sanguineus]